MGPQVPQALPVYLPEQVAGPLSRCLLLAVAVDAVLCGDTLWDIVLISSSSEIVTRTLRNEQGLLERQWLLFNRQLETVMKT